MTCEENQVNKSEDEIYIKENREYSIFLKVSKPTII